MHFWFLQVTHLWGILPDPGADVPEVVKKQTNKQKKPYRHLQLHLILLLT